MNFGKGPHAYANCKYAYQKCPIYMGGQMRQMKGVSVAKMVNNIDKVPRDLRHRYFEFSKSILPRTPT